MAKKITMQDLLDAKEPSKLISEMNFEDGIKLLEELVTKVESGSMSLDNAVSSYEKGTMLIEKLRALLSGAEEKLKVLEVKE